MSHPDLTFLTPRSCENSVVPGNYAFFRGSMRQLRIATLCACALFVVNGVRAQEVIINRTTTDVRGEIQLPGMGPRQVKTGTARLRGRITAVETGGPVRRAQIRISGPDIGSKTAVTDAEGRFEFRDLPAGRFNVSAAKSGFVTVQFGQYAAVRIREGDRSRRGAADGQGRYRDAARRRDFRPGRG